MKFIRFAIISVLALFAIVTAISLFIPSHVRISRAVNMHGRTDVILNSIGNLNNWKYWYPGFDTATLLPLTIKDNELTAARVSSTTTSIEITGRKANEITAEFRSAKNRTAESGWKIITYPETDSLTVQWYIDFRLRWAPWEKFLSLTYDKMYGTQMEQGLNNLKKNVER